MSAIHDLLLDNPTLIKNDPKAFLAEIRSGDAAPILLENLRLSVPEYHGDHIPQTTYSRYRQFEYTGEREGYQRPYYAKRSMLTRAVAELIFATDEQDRIQTRNAVHDLLWNICEETSWLVPAHEEQGPDFWDLRPSPRTWQWGTNTMLTRQPDSIDLFAAETGASLAETIFLVGDQLEVEVVQRVRQEVERHIFTPYLAYGRKHWWHKGALNWNGVCNGSVGLAFLRLEKDSRRLAEALDMVLEGFEAYLATGFEPDGGSIEGPGYWNYGLMYFVTLAEALRESSYGKLDLLDNSRLVDIAQYPLGMALAPGTYVNFGDATEQTALQPGIVQRLAERTGVNDLRGLLVPLDKLEGRGYSAAKLAITFRDFAWWDGQTYPFPASACQDIYLPDCAIVKFAGHTTRGEPVILVAKAGHNDGHHSHTDVGHFVLNIAGESLLCDPGRGLYSKEYFRQTRYDNFFCNSLSHNVPRIDGKLQLPGPEFGGIRQYRGQIVEHQPGMEEKRVVIEIQDAYGLPGLRLARRRLDFNPATGETRMSDEFGFSGKALGIEESFITWAHVQVQGPQAIITGEKASVILTVLEPASTSFEAVSHAEDCRVNRREGVLTRLSAQLPAGTQRFALRIEPKK